LEPNDEDDGSDGKYSGAFLKYQALIESVKKLLPRYFSQ